MKEIVRVFENLRHRAKVETVSSSINAILGISQKIVMNSIKTAGLAQNTDSNATRRVAILRTSAIAACTCGFSWNVSALSQSPSAPQTLKQMVLKADVIVVGELERFVFRGVDLIANRHERDRDFNEDNSDGNRTLDAIVKVREVILNRSAELSEFIRINQPTPGKEKRISTGELHVYLLKKLRTYKSDLGMETIFSVITRPLSVDERPKIVKEISKLHAK